MSKNPFIAIISGSVNDRKTVEPVLEQFRAFAIRLEYYVASAHRSPEKLKELITRLETQNIRMYIAVAGHAAHLGGVIASLTLTPVYGVPMASSDLKGVDSLYSTVMMPGGIPVAAFGIGASGLKNAILMACAHLAKEDETLFKQLKELRAKQAEKIFVKSPAWTNQS